MKTKNLNLTTLIPVIKETQVVRFYVGYDRDIEQFLYSGLARKIDFNNETIDIVENDSFGCPYLVHTISMADWWVMGIEAWTNEGVSELVIFLCDRTEL